MDFTAEQLSNIANSALDFYMKGPAIAQSIQERPLYDAMLRAKKTFPGGKEFIRVNVKGEYVTAIEGYSGADRVSFKNPAKVRQAYFPWKEIHAGIEVLYTELKKDGISIVDSINGEDVEEHSERDITVISDIFQDKLDDMAEGWARTFNAMLWADGSADANLVPGVLSIIRDVPTTGVVGGIDSSVNTWWRNRSRTSTSAGGAITSSTSLQTATKTLRAEVRQLRRYGGRPSLILCGSTALANLEAEIHEKGSYTQAGFMKGGATEIGMPTISMYGVGDFVYDPTLDDLGYQNRVYMIDPRHLKLMPMEGEDRKKHAPARPFDQYVLYRAMTWTGGLIANQLNCHGVYEIN